MEQIEPVNDNVKAMVDVWAKNAEENRPGEDERVQAFRDGFTLFLNSYIADYHDPKSKAQNPWYANAVQNFNGNARFCEHGFGGLPEVARKVGLEAKDFFPKAPPEGVLEKFQGNIEFRALTNLVNGVGHVDIEYNQAKTYIYDRKCE